MLTSGPCAVVLRWHILRECLEWEFSGRENVLETYPGGNFLSNVCWSVVPWGTCGGILRGELCAGLQVPVCSSYDLVNTDMVKITQIW